jgi:hypothetical protein
MKYPEKLIRGISSSDYIDQEGRVSAQAFQFDDMGRDDGLLEASINWYDDEGALEKLLNQKKQGQDDVYQFKAGAAILSRAWLDDTIARPNAQGTLSYERASIEDNPYHGNLLRKQGLSKAIYTMLSASIAMCVEHKVMR